MTGPQNPSGSPNAAHQGSAVAPSALQQGLLHEDLAGDSLLLRVEREGADRRVLESLTEAEQQQLAEILEQYLADLEAGNRVDANEILQSHPHLGEALSVYLKSIETLFHAGAAVAGGEGSGRDGGESAAHPSNLSQSSRLGDYIIRDEIGRGGMGVVYAADQISLERRVALKTLPFAGVMDGRQVARFKNEAQAAAGLHHPNIVPVYGVGCERGIHYFSMQLIEGQSLEQAIAQLRGVGGERKDAAPSKTTANHFSTQKSIRSLQFARSVARLGRQAAAALHYAHCSGVVHRDIKPSNLLLDADSKLWVTDFGLARIANAANLTVSGDMIGTARYMSPEQARGRLHEVDHRTDIYSLGITLYELLTLQPALDADTRHELLRAVAEETPVPPRHWNPSIPVDLETIVLKAIEKRRDDRYTSADELADDLGHFLDGRPTLAKRPGWHEHAFRWASRHRNLVTASVAALTLALLLVSAAALMLRAANDRTEVEAQRSALYLRETQRVVDNFGAMVDERLEHLPGSTGLRAELLGELEKYYSAFLEQAGDDPSFAIDLATTRFRLAAVHERMGEIGRAAEGYQLALAGFERLLGQSPENLDRLAEVALCHNNLGQVAAKQGDHPTAKGHYETSLAMYTTLAAAGHRTGQSGLGRTTMNLGLLLSSQHDPEAGRVLTHAHQTLESLASQSPDNLDVVDQLALCENNLASVILESDPDRAEDLLRTARSRYERLTALRPSSPEHRSDQALTIGNLAAVLARRGDHDSAIELFDQVRRVRERLIEMEPDVPSHVFDLAITHQQLGQIMVTLERWEPGAEAYATSIGLLAELLARNPGDHRAVSNLGRASGNLGMIEARRGNHERAVELLDKAAEHQELAIGLSPENRRYQELLEHHRDQAAKLRPSDPSTPSVGS